MKNKLKHLLAAAIPFWLVQAVILPVGYTGGDVILRIYLPIFVISAVFLLMGQFWAGHGVWLAATAGLLVEWLMNVSGAGGQDNVGGILANIAISLVGYALCGLLQMAVSKRKKKKLENT